MRKEELVAAFAATAKQIFDAADVFVANGWSKTGTLSDDAQISRLAAVEAGKSYYIANVTAIETKEKLVDGKKPETLRSGKTIALDLLEAESGTPARVYLGTLQRNMVAATKSGFNGTVGAVKSQVGKFITVSQYERGELKADRTRDIKINYSVVDNI